jgi:predicted RNA methylase
MNTDSLRYIHSWHYEMLANQERSSFYDHLIKDHCRDKVVLEIGTGSGLLAVLEIKHGAKKVICCEENPLLALAARNLFRRLGVEEKIQLIAKKSNDIATEEIPAADVILHELFGSDPFGEDCIPTLADARRFLKNGGFFLPEKIQLIYQAIPPTPLEKKLFYADVELLEMEELLKQIHPGLREKASATSEIFKLPATSIDSLLEKPYAFEEHNPKIRGVDAVEVSFLIQHGDLQLQAAGFETTHKRQHWSPMVFYKMDVPSDHLSFAVKNQNKLTVS